MNTLNYETITQTAAHSKTSDRYSFIPTSRVLGVFGDNGWYPAKVQEANVREVTNKGFQKHLVRLRNQEVSVGDEFPEILLINSHMGSASFKLMLGFWRLVCSNGMIVGDTLQSHRIMHTGYKDDQVNDAIKAILDVTPSVTSNVNQWKQIELNRDETEAYAKAAIELRFDGEKYAVDPYAVTQVRRGEDRKNDLWTTFNRVQENLVKGGVRQTRSNGSRTRSREVKGIDGNVTLNRALWTLTEKMAELKVAN